MNDTVISRNELIHLKNAVKAYEIAILEGFVPSGVEDKYVQGTDDWIGEEPQDIANDICKLIKNI